MPSASNVVAFPARRRDGLELDAVAEERQRIARELHDVVSHGFATVTVNASAALAALADRPQQAAEALQAIKAASDDALSELRMILGVLRSDIADRVPVAGLARLAALVASVTAAGVETRLGIDGRSHPLPADIDAVAYRIAQEALTNVLRHAPGSSADVRITYGRTELIVEVENARSVAGASPSPGGRGIVGMRERAAGVGGELAAGVLPSGRFRVRARLPVVKRS